MHPVVHPFVGYLCYTGYTRLQREDHPQGDPSVVAVFAAILPDLIDHPLWLVGLTPVGRTIGHSLFGGAVLVGVAGAVARRRGRQDLGIAFAIGYVSHIAADVPWHVISGDVHELGFLLWPVTDMPAYSGVKVVGTVGGVEVTTLWFEVMIVAVGVTTWWRDGRPGVDVIRRQRRHV